MSVAEDLDFVVPLRDDPLLALAFAYCIMGGTGPAPIRAVFLKTKFDQLPAWGRANVVHLLRDIVGADLTATLAFHVKIARAGDDAR